MANRTKNNRPEWMLNPRFRELLPHAPALERIEHEAKQGNSAPNKELMEAKKKEITTVHQEYTRLKSKPEERTEAQKVQKAKKLSELASKRSQLRLELAELCAGITLEDADLPILQAFYEKYQSTSNAAHQLLVKYGISEQEIATFNALKRSNNDMAIPNVIFDGAKIGHPGIYLKKLDTMNDKGAALAACLGKVTNCCQYLGGAGSECAIHGITSPDGGFYVVCKGDARQPNIDDPILAQSWTWRSQSGALCCDSIEVSRGGDGFKEITDMYRYFAHELCSNPELKHFKVGRINTGAQSGITSDVASKVLPTTTEQPIDYKGYRDSQSQLLLADPTIPYLFYDKDIPQPLQDMIKKDTKNYFKSLFDTESPLKENTPLQQTVCLLLGHHQELLSLLKEVAGTRDEELEQLIKVNRRYIEALNSGRIDFEALKEGAYLKATNNVGINALHLSATTPESLKVILELYPESERLDAVMRDIINRTEFNSTVLQYVAKRPVLLKIILGSLPESKRLDAVKMPARYSESVWHFAAANPESLKAILESLPESSRLDAVRMADHHGDTVLHYAATKPESLKFILESLQKSERLDAVKMTGISDRTVLHNAATTPELLKVILELYPKSERLDAVKMADHYGRTVLFEAATDPESLKVILGLYPEPERLDAVKMAEHYGSTVLHEAATDPESIKVILESLPDSDRVKAVKVIGKFGETVLDIATKHPSLLEVILKLVPQAYNIEAKPSETDLVKKAHDFKSELNKIKGPPGDDNSPDIDPAKR